MGFVWLWVLVPLQRPVQWTMAAVIARVTIQWQESAAAVLLASLCSRTARPAKVKHHHSNCICHKLNLQLVVLQDTLGLFLHPELTGIAIELFMPPPPFVLALVPFCYLNFLFLDYIIIVLQQQLHILWCHQSFTTLCFSAAYFERCFVMPPVLLTVFPLHYRHPPFQVLAEHPQLKQLE